MRRTIRSKAGRYLVLKHFGFKCAMCGCDKLDELELDHIIPYAITGDTNIHDLQVLCKICNKKKGKKIMPEWIWRKHQQKMISLARDIVAGYHSGLEIIVGDITCGGGKSSLPPILLTYLRETGIKYAVWLAPRRTLLGQAEDAFLDADIRRELKHNLAIRQATNEPDPVRLRGGLTCNQGMRAGYVTTYAAIGVDAGEINLDWCKKYTRQYLLVLDECQQVYEGCEIEPYIKQMHYHAGLTLAMSGTLQRGDGKRVSFVEYNGMREGQWQVRTENSEHYHYLRYSRLDGLSDHALIESEVEFMDAQGRFRLKGEEVDFESLRTVDADNVHRALDTALKTEHAKTMMDACTDHWRAHRKDNDRSKVLYTAPDQARAKEYVDYLKSRHGLSSSEIDIAVSDDGEEALKALERFKDNGRNGLKAVVTVGMAYMGFDVPSLDHLCNLSKFRTWGWQGQLLARPARFDRKGKPYEQQKAYIWMPDDYLAHKVVDEILADQAAIARDRVEGGGGGGGPQEFSQPISSTSTQSSIQELSHGATLDNQKTLIVKAVEAEIVLAGGNPIPKLTLWNILENHKNGGYDSVSHAKPAEPSPTRASQSEKWDQQEVETLVKAYVNSKAPYNSKNPDPWRSLKRQIDIELNNLVGKKKRGKDGDWVDSDYKRAIDYLYRHYPVDVKCETEI